MCSRQVSGQENREDTAYNLSRSHSKRTGIGRQHIEAEHRKKGAHIIVSSGVYSPGADFIVSSGDYCRCTLVQWEAEISFEWVLPLRFERRCVQLFCDLFEQVLTEELRYKWQLTYAVTVSRVHYQDCRIIRVFFKTAPEAVERTQDLFWQVLRSMDQEEEKYSETRQEALASIYCMDYSGYDLLESAMDDLAGYHRLISFSEEIQQIQHITFECIVELARYLTSERHFCFIMLP